MRQIREVLRLTFEEKRSQRLVARALGVVRATVERVLRRFAGSGLKWPPDPPLSDAELERRLYGGEAHQGTAKVGARPDYAAAVVQLSHKGVTRQRLWQEYRDRLPAGEGIGYSVYCAELAAYRADRDLATRHDHVPGEHGYFDFAGLTLKYRAKSAGFCRQALTVLSQRPDVLPAGIKLAEATADLETRELRPRLARLTALFQRAFDTDIALGSNVVAMALYGYKQLKLNGGGTGLEALQREAVGRFGTRRRLAKTVIEKPAG